MVGGASGWWRRSRWAVVALVILVPAAVAASLSIDAFDYLASRPSMVTTVEPGHPATFGEASVRVIDSWTATSDSAVGERYAVPEGTALVSVTLELDAVRAGEDFRCQTRLRDPVEDRRWWSGYTDTDYFPGEGLPDGSPSTCTWAENAFPFELTFLIPEEARDAVVIEVFTSDRLPEAYHLRLS